MRGVVGCGRRIGGGREEVRMGMMRESDGSYRLGDGGELY